MTRSIRLVFATVALAVAVQGVGAQGMERQSDAGTTAAAGTEALAVNAASAANATLPAARDARPSANAAGPRIESATAGVKAIRGTEPAPPSPPKKAETRQNQAMMIVGFAGLIAGAVIGDDVGTIIMVGGAGLGLWGLYRYLE